VQLCCALGDSSHALPQRPVTRKGLGLTEKFAMESLSLSVAAARLVFLFLRVVDLLDDLDVTVHQLGEVKGP
jgi:hypothetical protein